MVHYFDNCATTRADDDVVAILSAYAQEKYYNPSARSSHSLQIANDMASAREKIAKLLGVAANELVFTSGGTESNNMAICGALRQKHGNIVVTEGEHSSVFNAVCHLESKGFDIRIAKLCKDGHIDVADFLSKVDQNTILACFMHVNNETGAINDVKSINLAVKNINPRVTTFADGIQAIGKIPVNLRHLGVDLYTFSAHKFHGSKGIGALYVKNGTKFAPIVHGGGQEKNLRSGTEYVGGIVSMAVALQNACEIIEQNANKFEVFKSILRSKLQQNVDNFRENCPQKASPAIFSLSFADIKGEVLLHMLEQYDIIIGTGSACSSKNKQSRIAKAIGMDHNWSQGIVRISFCKHNTEQEVQFLAEKLCYCVNLLQKTILGA